MSHIITYLCLRQFTHLYMQAHSTTHHIIIIFRIEYSRNICKNCSKQRLKVNYDVVVQYWLINSEVKLDYLNRSWPAVSQIWSLTVFPPTLTTLLPNSTPIVCVDSCLTENKFQNYITSTRNLLINSVTR